MQERNGSVYIKKKGSGWAIPLVDIVERSLLARSATLWSAARRIRA